MAKKIGTKFIYLKSQAEIEANFGKESAFAIVKKELEKRKKKINN
jgi:hypothetical protein